MQVLQPYYVLDEAETVAPHFMAVYNGNRSLYCSWNGSTLTTIVERTITQVPDTSKYTVPSHLSQVVEQLQERLGPVKALHVKYLGEYARCCVTKMILLGATRVLKYRAIIRITPNGSHQMELVTGRIVKYESDKLPTEVLNCFTTVEAERVQAVLDAAHALQTRVERNRFALEHLRPLCSIHRGCLDPGVLQAIPRPLVSVKEYHTLATAGR